MTKEQAINKALAAVKGYLKVYIPDNAKISEVFVNELDGFENMVCCASIELYKEDEEENQ